MNDANTASIRTTWTLAVVTLLAFAASRVFDVEIGTDDPWIILVAPAVTGVLHRLFLVISELVPYFGYIVFGINRSPKYSDPPPAVPALANDAGFADNDLLWTLVGILAVIALIIWIVARV